MRRASVIAIFLVPAWIAFAEEATPPSEKLEVGVWNVPPEFILTLHPTNSASSQNVPGKLVPGFRSGRPPELSQYDAKAFLEASGITFPPGSEAIFDAGTGSLVVRNTRENLELVDNLSEGGPVVSPSNIAIEISTFECALPAEYATTAAPWPSYFQLIKDCPDRLLLDRVSTVTKSGIRAAMNHILSKSNPTPAATPAEKKAGETFQPGELGTIAESELVLGPDGQTVDANLTYRFRQMGAGNTPSEVTLNTSFTTTTGHPVVISVSPSPTEKGKFIVVVANIRLAGYRDWGLKKDPPDATPGKQEKASP